MFRDVPHMQVFPGRRGSCHIWQKCAIQRTFFFPINLQFLPCENFHGIFVSMTQPPHVGFHCLRLHNGSHSSVQHLDHNPQFFCIPPIKRVQQLFPNDTNFSPMKKLFPRDKRFSERTLSSALLKARHQSNLHARNTSQN